MAQLWIGTSGWSYGHWRERFYPAGVAQRNWLEYYAAQFDTVEINASFYYLPSSATFAAWHERVPDSFLFAVKAPRQITHWRRLRNSEEALEVFFDRAGKLEEKLGPILFQLPPRFPADVELLEGFVNLLPRQHRYSFEFRDPSWLNEDIYSVLNSADIALCRSSSSSFPDADVVTASFVYLRMHGGHYDTSYSEDELRYWADRIHDWQGRGLDVYVYFNNDANAYAIANALTLAQSLALVA